MENLRGQEKYHQSELPKLDAKKAAASGVVAASNATQLQPLKPRSGSGTGSRIGGGTSQLQQNGTDIVGSRAKDLEKFTSDFRKEYFKNKYELKPIKESEKEDKVSQGVVSRPVSGVPPKPQDSTPNPEKEK